MTNRKVHLRLDEADRTLCKRPLHRDKQGCIIDLEYYADASIMSSFTPGNFEEDYCLVCVNQFPDTPIPVVVAPKWMKDTIRSM